MKLLVSKYLFLFLCMSPISFPALAQRPHADLAPGDDKKIAAQKADDEKKLQAFFTKNHISPSKTPLGLYYTISKEGTGNKILAGETVSLNYTGKLLDWTVFDSNTDPALHHTDPLIFEVGKGMVIKGYDKGVQLLKRGSVATLYIPSGLAYGERTKPQIPANSILIFDVEVLDVIR